LGIGVSGSARSYGTSGVLAQGPGIVLSQLGLVLSYVLPVSPGPRLAGDLLSGRSVVSQDWIRQGELLESAGEDTRTTAGGDTGATAEKRVHRCGSG
jgi:hypothetical protein